MKGSAATAIFAVAFGLRLLHLRAIMPLELGTPPVIGMDRWLSTHIAAAVARGNWLGGWSAAYDSSPGYALLLGVLHRAAGGGWLGPLCVQAALGALVPLLLYGVGARLFSARVGALAAGLAALYAPAIFYETLLVKFALLPITVAAALACVVRGRDERAARWLVPAGMALGALVLLRPNALLTAAVMALWVIGPGAGLVWRAMAVGTRVALGAALVAVPLVLHARAAGGESGGEALWGIHFFIGTNPEADGRYTEVPGVRDDIVGHVVDARRIAEHDLGRPLVPGEVSRYWFEKGLGFVREHPFRYLLLEARKVWIALDGDEEGSFGDDFHDYRRASWVLRLPLPTFAAVGPLGLLGLCLTLVGRPRARVLHLFVASYLVCLLPFFVTGRYRLPLVPPMLVLAAFALCWLEENIRRRRSRALLGAAVLLGAATAGLASRELLPGVAFTLAGGLGAAAALARSDGGQSPA